VTTPRPTTVDELVLAVLPLLAVLRTEPDPISVPDDADAEALLRAAFTDRGGPVRQRASLKQPTRDESAFAAALRFHSGRNLNLTAPVMNALAVGRERYAALDALATVAMLVRLGRSVGTDEWRRVLAL
jgi:hypothetical protein